MTMADTVAVMNKGKIEQMGAPAELYELPFTRFVATFLGQSNLFDGLVTGQSEGNLTVAVGSENLAVPAARSQVSAGAITVGVRPEKLEIHRKAPAASTKRQIVGPGTVVDTSFAGVSTQYVVSVPVLGDITVFEQNDGDIVGVGEQVWLSWSTDHAFGIPVEDSFDENDLSTRALAATVK